MDDATIDAAHPFAGRPLPTWYDDAKFGIFIHWGPYAVPCYAPLDADMGDLLAAQDWQGIFRSSPYTEWYLNSWAIAGSPTEAHHRTVYGDTVTYADFVAQFRERGAGVDMAQWADLFAAAGARYVVPVTKHHDGFLMWRSAFANPHREAWMAERDHIGDLAAAVRDRGMRFGVYYSGGLDWTFEPPPLTDFASMIAKVPVSPEYVDYATAHVDELIDRFAPSVLWNDIAWPFTSDPNTVFARYYDRVPDGVVNDRYNLLAVRSGTLHADFSTPEYSTSPHGDMKWEVCRGIGRSFGYNRTETDATMPTADELVWMLVDIVARGGNLLLNVGPAADGQIPFAQAARLMALGWWLRANGDAVYGTRPWQVGAEPGVGATADGRQVRYTQSGTDPARRYAIVQGAPAGELRLPGISPSAGAEVRLLGNDRLLAYTVRGSGTDAELVVALPDHLPAAPATVFAIEG